MYTRNVSVTLVAHRVFGGLTARELNVDYRGLILLSLILLLIIGRGAGTG